MTPKNHDLKDHPGFQISFKDHHVSIEILQSPFIFFFNKTDLQGRSFLVIILYTFDLGPAGQTPITIGFCGVSIEIPRSLSISHPKSRANRIIPYQLVCPSFNNILNIISFFNNTCSA